MCRGRQKVDTDYRGMTEEVDGAHFTCKTRRIAEGCD